MRSKLPDGWQKKRIGEIAEVVGGGTPSTRDHSNFGGGIPWVTPKDLSLHHERRISRGERNLTKKGLDSSSAKLLPKDSVIFSSRAPIGYVAIAGTSLTTNQGCRNLVLKDNCSPEYIYYVLKTMTEVLKNHASGTTFDEISGSALKQIEVMLPPLPEQRRIASILSAFDDKIELNARMNRTLEEMASAIFKSWFMDFEPFQDEEFEYNEEVEKEIPKGWEVRGLDEVSENFVTMYFGVRSPASGVFVCSVNVLPHALHLYRCPPLYAPCPITFSPFTFP
jgi:type I restriction enzyme S subunit